jgi:hypothetical protein
MWSDYRSGRNPGRCRRRDSTALESLECGGASGSLRGIVGARGGGLAARKTNADQAKSAQIRRLLRRVGAAMR